MLRSLILILALTLPPAEPGRLIVIGDSITVGRGASAPERAWAHLTARALGRTLHTSAISGSRAHEQPIPDVGPGDLVIWLVGYNDMRAGTDLASYRETVAAGVARLQAQGATVIIASGLRMPDYTRHGAVWGHGSDQAAGEYARAVADLALFVDLGALTLTMPDGAHPDDAGHAAIAQAVLAPTVRAQAQAGGIRVEWSAGVVVCPWLEWGGVRAYAGGALPCRAAGAALVTVWPDSPARVVLRDEGGVEVAGVDVGYTMILPLVVR